MFPKGPWRSHEGPASGYRKVPTNLCVFMGTERNSKNGNSSLLASVIRTQIRLLYGCGNESRSFYHDGNEKCPSLVVRNCVWQWKLRPRDLKGRLSCTKDARREATFLSSIAWFEQSTDICACKLPGVTVGTRHALIPIHLPPHLLLCAFRLEKRIVQAPRRPLT